MKGRACTITLILCTLTGALFGQYANNWIDYSQKYFKIKISREGLYKINYNTLYTAVLLAGDSLANIHPGRIQLFNRGEEQYIYIKGQDDGVFDPGDYILFAGFPNDGWLDTLVYDTAGSQANPHLSLFNDTATYFLTWKTDVSDTNNRRFTSYTNTNYGAYTPAGYFLHKKWHGITGTPYYKTNYFPGELLEGSGASQPAYTAGEGWYRKRFSSSDSIELNIPYAYTGSGAPNAVVETRVASVNNPAASGNNHQLIIYVGSNPTAYVNDQWAGYEMHNYTLSIAPSYLISSPLLIQYNSGSYSNDYKAAAYAEIKYPRLFDLNNLPSGHIRMILPPHPDTTYFYANNISSSVSYIYDLTHHKRIAVTYSSATSSIKALVATPDETDLLVARDNAITTVSLKRIGTTGQFVDFGASPSDYVIVTHKKLLSAAMAYQAYRSNRFPQAAVYDIDDLYDQFSYGIRMHPLSIQNFIDYVSHTWPEAPQYLLLFGKSIAEKYCRFDVNSLRNNLVPTMGTPASDNMLTAGLDTSLYEPLIPTGRISANNATQANDYLNKVMAFEQSMDPALNPYYPNGLQNHEWQKVIMHFAGGNNSGQQTLFQGYLQQYEAILKDTLFGADIRHYYKTSSAPIDQNSADDIATRIQKGCAMMTFFGHASGSGFDINIDNVSNFNNAGKYPLLLANSCYAGDIHQPLSISTSTSEEYVLAANAGVIGFIAATDLGFAGSLHAYSLYLHQNLGYKHYGKGIGFIMQQAIHDFEYQTSSPLMEYTALEMTLHGDPALQIYAHDKPDLVLDQGRIYFTPESPGSDQDSFKLNVIVTNIGRATDIPFIVEVTRSFQDGTVDSIYRKTVNGIDYKDTVTFTLATDASSGGSGLNSFDIWVDNLLYQSVPEMEEAGNNHINAQLFISGNDLIPAWPPDQAVIPDINGLTLKASTGNPFATSKQYVFELDTTDTYDSPIMDSITIVQSGGVLKWSPAYPVQSDSIVYFWRCSPYDSDPQQLKWREHSFQYIPGKVGWGQYHHFQFKNNDFNFLNYSRAPREITFDTSSVPLQCNVYGIADKSNERSGTEYLINNVVKDYGICNDLPGIYVVVIDSINLEPWSIYLAFNNTNPDHSFGNYKDGVGCLTNQPDYFFMFRLSQPSEMDAMVNMLNSVPDGNYILAYTVKWGLFQDTSVWKNQHFTAFEQLGADSIRYVGDTIPYIFFVQKGDISSAKESIGTYDNDYISLIANMRNNASFGSMATPVLGPAAHWDSLFWDVTPMEYPKTADTAYLSVYAIDNQGNKTVRKKLAQTHKSADLSADINAADFPYIQIEYNTEDKTAKTPMQIDRLHVLYDPVPEAALNPSLGYTFESSTVKEGAKLKLKVPIENISPYDMDSLRVQYKIYRGSNVSDYNYPLQDSLRAGQILNDLFEIDTKGLSGDNTLWIDVNPEDSLWQPEQYHFNNIGMLSFKVDKDNANPLLDITFDGVHILDGDIVSPEPGILIRLKDENPYLALDDTADFKLYLTDPQGILSPIHFVNGSGEEVLQFTPGTVSDNRASIEWHPSFPVDGTYKLKVEARDASKNKAGKWDYTIRFEVINESTITQILNYPNPFSTATRFVFTLTGAQVPDELTIQIMTVTGRVIRQITVDELGYIHAGRNITEYAWDGRDEFGDPLANGVYLYRVFSSINGNPIKQRDSGADSYIQKGFGKMYLMR